MQATEIFEPSCWIKQQWGVTCTPYSTFYYLSDRNKFLTKNKKERKVYGHQKL